ncbi:MAG: LamG domain-containing protein [Sedimentisphaerales bacterium]
MKTFQSVIIVAIFLTFCTFTLASDIYHPVAYWTFDESSGTTAYDSAGVCNGTLINGVTRTAGKFGNAVQLDGVDDYVQISDANDSAIEFNKNSKFTISLWIKSQDNKWFLTKLGRTTGSFGYFMGDHDRNTYRFVIDSHNIGASYIDSTTSVPVNTWAHIVAVYDNTQMSIYSNGVLSNTGTFTYDTGTTYPTSNMTIGAWVGVSYFKGLIDDVRIYNYALSAGEVAQLYQIQPASDIDHPVAHWKFDESNDLTAYDSADSHNGTLMNGAARTAGKFGNAVLLDGIDDYVKISDANDAALEFNKNSSFTISCWVKPRGTQHSGWIIDKMRVNRQYGTFGYWLGYGAASGHFNFAAESSNQGTTNAISPNGSAPAGSWYHVVCVYDNTQMSIYLDGVQRAANTFTYNTGTTVPDGPMGIGAWLVDSQTSDYFDGLIDDVRVYNYALDANEVAELYAEGEPNLQSIEIAGPNSVPEESDTQYRVIGHYDDGSRQNITADANLTVVPDEFALIDANGLLSTERLYQLKEICTINADYEGFSASKSVTIYPLCDGNQCTEQQIFKRDIADTVKIKQGIIEDLNYAMKIERVTMQMIPRVAIKLPVKERSKILKINIKLLAALADELWAKQEINKSVDSLEEALKILLTVPGSGSR